MSGDKPIRVLQIAGGFSEGVSGGVAAFIKNYYRYIDKQRFLFDFLSISYQCFELYRDELEASGGRLYCLNIAPFGGITGRARLFRALPAFLREHEYDIIHVNLGSLMNNLLCSYVAKKNSSAKIIAHSHNDIPYPPVKRIINNCVKQLFSRSADCFLACSSASGQYMFPKKVVNSKSFFVLKNAIDCEAFQFNEYKRAEYRKLFSLGDELLIAHVGRFLEQKNHTFILDVFAEVHKKDKGAKLLLIGTGKLLDAMKGKASALNLENNILWAGQRGDVNHCLQAADVFLFPSLYEGLPISAIEAQVSGLPVLASHRISDEARITPNYYSMTLSLPAEAWAEIVLKIGSCCVRRDMSSEARLAGYDLKSSVRELESVYEGMYNLISHA